jgi:hypothetical protein
MTEETAKANKLLAAGEVAAVQVTLTGDKYSGAEWDVHKRMNAAAGALANGGGGSMEMQSAAISLMATAITLDRIREPERFKENFSKVHGAICQFTPLLKHEADGKVIYPWADKVEAPGDGSELNFSLLGSKVASKGKAATVLAAFAAVVLVIVLLVGSAFYYMGKINREEIEQSIKDTVLSVQQANMERAIKGDADETK